MALNSDDRSTVLCLLLARRLAEEIEEENVSYSVLGSMLDGPDIRSLRLVCRDLRAAVDTDVDVDQLVLPVDSNNCGDAAIAQSMARFHCDRSSTSRLKVQMSYSAAKDAAAAGTFMAAYSAQCIERGRLQAWDCHVSIAAGCEVQARPLVALLKVLPRLETLRVECDDPEPCSNEGTPQQLTSALAQCEHLHTLVLDRGFTGFQNQDQESVLSRMVRAEGARAAAVLALSQISQLHVLSLDWMILTGDLAPLSSLPHLECLCLSECERAGMVVPLPGLRTLCGAWDSLENQPYSAVPVAWHPGMWGTVQLCAFPAFSSVRRMAGMRLTIGADQWEPQVLQLLPAAVQQLASSGNEWAWQFEPSGLWPTAADFTHDFAPGSLHGLRNIEVLLDQSLEPTRADFLSGLFAAAPEIGGVCLRLQHMLSINEVLVMLRSLEDARCMHTLWIIWEGVTGDRPEVQQAVVHHLTAATGGEARCPSLVHIFA